jgi:hypothetical protein
MIQMGEHTYPLAADFTVPLALMLASTDPKKYELARLLNPAKYAEPASISRLQPYDPNKTVVLVIHGLTDSQATWTPMLNRLRGDADIPEVLYLAVKSGDSEEAVAAWFEVDREAIRDAIEFEERLAA